MRGPEQRWGSGALSGQGGEVQPVSPSACPGACAASGSLGRSPQPKDHLHHYLTSAEWRCLEERAFSGKNAVAFHVRTWILSVAMP